MAKKIVRGITDIKTISNQDFDTNNVNDLLSDGKNNYIHRKKSDGTEEYHNLTNNIKTIESDVPGLLSVTNYNNSKNSATLHPHHDQSKSQLLGSPDQTINVQNGENGSAELTTVDVNPEKVLQHDNLLTSYGLSKTTSENTTELGITATSVDSGFNLNDLNSGFVVGSNLQNAPTSDTYFILAIGTSDGYVIQTAFKCLSDISELHTGYTRSRTAGSAWTGWRSKVVDKSVIDGLLAQKQNTLTSNTSIGVSGTGLRQLYTQSQTYTHANGTLKTYVKSVANSSSVSTVEEEFHFLAKMDKSQTSADFTLNAHDTAVFQYLIDTYGLDNKINVCGSAFTLNGSNLNFNSNGSMYNPHIINFNDIIPTSAINTQQSAPSRGDSVTVDKLDKTVETEKETE